MQYFRAEKYFREFLKKIRNPEIPEVIPQDVLFDETKIPKLSPEIVPTKRKKLELYWFGVGIYANPFLS